MRAGIRGLTFHDLRGTAVVTLARAGCNEVEIYSITGHKPSDVRAILTAHYLPRDAEVAGNAIAKLNPLPRSNRGRKSPNCAPNCAENCERENEESVAKSIGWGARTSNLRMAESKSAALPLGYAPSGGCAAAAGP